MAPVTQYFSAKTLKLSIHFTAGSHEWLPYSAIPPFPKQIYKHQFAALPVGTDGAKRNLKEYS